MPGAADNQDMNTPSATSAARGAPLSAADRAALEARLHTEQQRLRSEIAERLRNQDEPETVGLANRMAETGDWAQADMLAEQDIALVARELAELRQVDAALRRITDDAYGQCSGCAAPIPLQRLLAYPAATRCVACQSAEERGARQV